MAKRRPRGVVFCSGGASSLVYLREHDPNFGETYKIVGVLSDKPGTEGITYARKHGFPVQEFNYQHWCKEVGVTTKNLKARERFYLIILLFLRNTWAPDFIILSGFDWLIIKPLIEAFPGRILNVHPALLNILDENGKRKYIGNKGVVARTMEAGDLTGSTVHIVEPEADMGPIVMLSDPLPYKKGDDPKTHQDLMKMACDGPAYQAALEKLISAGWPRVMWKP